MENSDYNFPFKTVLSLRPIVEYWHGIASGDEPLKAKIARTILAQVKDVPELLEPIEDLEVIEKNRELVDMLVSALLPIGMSSQAFAAAVQPYNPVSFFETEAAKEVNLLDSLVSHFKKEDPKVVQGKSIKAYTGIVNTLYRKLDREVFPVFFRFTMKKRI